MKELNPFFRATDSEKIPRNGLMLQLNLKNSVQKYMYNQQNLKGWWSGVWEGLGMDKNLGLVMFVASSKYGHTYPAFPKIMAF